MNMIQPYPGLFMTLIKIKKFYLEKRITLV